MEQTEKKTQIVRCSDCRTEFTDESIDACLANARCGRDGGSLRDSCKIACKADGAFLFKLVPNESTPKVVKDNKKPKRSEKKSEESIDSEE